MRKATARRAVALLLVGLAGGCSFAGDATTDTASIGAGAVVGAVTANPFIGIAVGVAARYAAGAAVKAIQRDLQDAIQTRIATVAGPAEPNVSLPWSIEQDIPGASETGAVIVVREFGAPLIECRELVFSVLHDEETNFYVGTICKTPQGAWKWTVSEPATSRWGSLQ